jgi:Tn3 transposase DDE domain/Domain of unknown function (DUF4158)
LAALYSVTCPSNRFGSAARGDRIYQAGHALGHLLRTVYLCDYFTLPDFRRPLYRVLERGESVHALQRQICTQLLPAKRGRRTEELIATSGALTLLTNCVMAWNTGKHPLFWGCARHKRRLGQWQRTRPRSEGRSVGSDIFEQSFPILVSVTQKAPYPPLLGIVAAQLKVTPAAWSQYAKRDETRREHLQELLERFELRQFDRSY